MADFSSIDISKAFGKHDYQIRDCNYKEKLMKHPIIQGLFTIGDYFIMASNMHTMMIEYLGGECEKVTGYANNEILKLQGDFFPGFTTPEDTKFILEVISIAIQYHQSRPENERELIFTVYYYHARKKDGKMINVQHQSIPVMFDENMVPFVFANIVTDITHLNIAKLPQAMLIDRHTKDKYHMYPENLKLVKPVEIFSKREKEIIRLLTMGKNSRQIGEELYISNPFIRI